MYATRQNRNGHLTSGRLLAKNTLWNLLGSGTPMFVAVLCIPILIRGLGNERFGILTLAWALIGYASLFDLGLGRALTQLVARKLGAGEEREIPSLVWTSLVLMLLLGLAGTAVVIILSPWLTGHALNVPPSLRHETLQSFRLLGLSLPFVISTAGLRGLLEAHLQFGLINALRIPMGVFTFAGPLVVLPFSKSVVAVVAVLVVGRVAGWCGHLLLCLRLAPELRRSVAWERSSVIPLMKFGGWMTVSNVVSPFMVTLDRFVIGALISIGVVAYYATPYEMVTKLQVFSVALTGVMFPAFSASFAQDQERTALLFRRGLKSILLVLFPIVLSVVVFAHDGLRVWLGAEFAQHSYRVLQWLAIGVFLNSLALVPFTLLQAAGRPDMTAILHLIELPLYAGLLWCLINSRGIEGAAIAWSVRMGVDAFLLFALVRRLMPQKSAIRFNTALPSALTLIILMLAAMLQGPVVKAVFLAVTILGFGLVTWFRILTPEERTLVQSYR